MLGSWNIDFSQAFTSEKMIYIPICLPSLMFLPNGTESHDDVKMDY